jgi:predicted PurR-regulated permease PerM
MKPPEPRTSALFAHKGLAVLLVAVSLALAWILLPFYGALMWGAIVALLFAPLYRRLVVRLRGRRTAAALLTLLVVLFIVILPFGFITASLAREAVGIYQAVQSGELNPATIFRGVFDAMPAWVRGLLQRYGLVDFEALQRWAATGLTQGSKLIATQAVSIGQDAFDFVVGLFVMLYLAFFMIRDGDALARIIRRAIPLDAEHKQELLDTFATVVRATVKGNVLVAIVQGALGGLAFGFLGVRGALLWGVLMAFLSLLPAIGAGLVWLPVALYLLVTGSLWQGIALVAYGVLVIGLVDNLLRPVLVGRDTQMPDWLVMVTTLGGMALLGINGFVIGPAVAAMFIAAWHIHVKERPAGGRS